MIKIQNPKFKIIFLAIFLFGFFGLAKSSMAAATHYITPSGAGSKNGSDWNNAYQTLPASLTRGDTYVVAGGNYLNHTFGDAENGTTLITIRKASSAASYRDDLVAGWDSSFESAQAIWSYWYFTRGYYYMDGVTPTTKWATVGHGFKLMYSNPNATTHLLEASFIAGRSVNNITLRNIEFHLQGSAYDYEQFAIYHSTPGGSSSANWLIEYCYFHGQQCAVKMEAGPNHWIYQYNYIDANWSSSAHHGAQFTFWTAHEMTFRYNYMNSYNGTGAFTAYGSGYDNDNNEWYGNIIYGAKNYGNGTFASGDSSLPVSYNNWKIYNNTFVDGHAQIGGSINAGDNPIGWEVKNNLFYNNPTTVFIRMPGGTYDYNYQNASAWDWPIGAHDVTSTESASALFSNYAGGDYRLGAASQAVNAGADLGSLYNIDAEGISRPQGSAWDIGAFEYAASGAPDTTSPAAPTGLSVN